MPCCCGLNGLIIFLREKKRVRKREEQLKKKIGETNLNQKNK